MNEGVSFALIFCNLLVPLIERVTRPRAFGIPEPAFLARITRRGGAKS